MLLNLVWLRIGVYDLPHLLLLIYHTVDLSSNAKARRDGRAFSYCLLP
jgi:hypothetical protein